MPERPADERGGMQVVTRAAAVLEALAQTRGGQSLAALADRTGLPKTTVHRLCTALEQVGYVRVDAATGHREIGPALLRLAVLGRRDLRAVLEPYVERLSFELNETVDLAVLDGSDVVFIAQHPAPQRELMAIARVGAHFPAHSMASGKVLLATLSPEDLRRRLPERLEPALGGSRKNKADLLREIDDVRAGGLGVEREELRVGICAVAVAVTDVDGRSASIAVPMPASRFYQDEAAVASRLLEVRDEIRRDLLGE